MALGPQEARVAMNWEWDPIVAQDFGPGSVPVLLDADVVPRRCRFCGKGPESVTFRHEAHAIPFGLGNTTVLSRGECDTCNHEFGETIENDLVNFMGPIRTISGIRTRSKVPTFRRRRTSAAIRNEGQGLVVMKESDDTVIVRDGPDGKTLEVEVEYLPFDLESVGRAIARMAFFYLDVGLPQLGHVLAWVRGKVSWSPPIYEFLHMGGVTAKGVFMVMAPRSRRNDQPLVACLVCSCIAYFLPFPAADWSVSDPHWESLLLPFSMSANRVEIRRFDAAPGRVTGLRRTIRMAQQNGANTTTVGSGLPLSTR